MQKLVTGPAHGAQTPPTAATHAQSGGSGDGGDRSDSDDGGVVVMVVGRQWV